MRLNITFNFRLRWLTTVFPLLSLIPNKHSARAVRPASLAGRLLADYRAGWYPASYAQVGSLAPLRRRDTASGNCEQKYAARYAHSSLLAPTLLRPLPGLRSSAPWLRS